MLDSKAIACPKGAVISWLKLTAKVKKVRRERDFAKSLLTSF
jgi:hypothetical protein